MKVAKEAFPWRLDETFGDIIRDSDNRVVAVLYGFSGERCNDNSPGVIDRRIKILELANLIELAREVAYGIHYCPKEMVVTARKILARIEGRTT